MIKLSKRDVISSIRVGRVWLNPQGEAINIGYQPHDEWAAEHIGQLYPDWENEYNKISTNVGLSVAEENIPEIFFYLKGWARIWNDSIHVKESGMSNVRDFFIMNQRNYEPEDNLHFTVFTNDLSNFISTPIKRVGDFLN